MPRHSRLALLLALPLAAILGACTEDLQTGGTCPLLCPGQEIEVRDTILTDIVELDTNLIGFPFQGSEDPLLLAARGDTLDVRPVVRFDTLQRMFAITGEDTLQPITQVDSVYLSLFLSATEIATPTDWAIDVYDVFDSTLTDTVPTQLLPLFDPARLIGTYTGDTAFTDTLRVRIPIDTTYFRTMLGTPGHRFRVGLRVRSSASVMLRMNPSDVTNGPTISYKIVSVDSTVPSPRNVIPTSLTPAQPTALANDLRDFHIVAAAPDQSAAGTLVVGGLPGSRVYMRMNLPAWLTDTVGVLRAELILTQNPATGMAAADSLRLDGHLIVATNTVPTLIRAATLLTAANIYMPSQQLRPSDANTVRINVNNLVRQWNTSNPTRGNPTAILLRSASEGGSPGALRFYGSQSLDPAVRPRLRVSYTPGTLYGRP